mgnify:CR=1 FL=1
MEICFLDAVELSKKIKSGEISCAELMESHIKRIDKFEPSVKAWAYFDKEYLMARAKESDDLRVSGKPLGTLHGIPVGVKDIFATGDMPTECGTILRKGRITKNDSTVVSLLRDAGAIIMGKTVTTEFAYFDPGKTCNPHDVSRTPGGSSSGSAASVASFMCPLSIGSQTNGSMIRPASYCGVYGFKPTFGLVSRFGALRQSRILDQVGFFARSVNDIALMLGCFTILSPISFPKPCTILRTPFGRPAFIHNLEKRYAVIGVTSEGSVSYTHLTLPTNREV